MNRNEDRIASAAQTLLGVSIGDAFGDSFFGETALIRDKIEARQVADSKWEFTDDTVMSIAIFESLEASGDIDQDDLVKRFCINHDLDPQRGYGATLRRSLREISEGSDWRTVSKNVFDGQGSMGNGAAMRVCPLGAFYFDDLERVKSLATKSAEVTHANLEAIAGAMAIAVGTALTTRMGVDHTVLSPMSFLDEVAGLLPPCDTTSRIINAKNVSYDYHIETVKGILGNGINMTAQDTVPFALWCAAHNLQNFEEGLWKAVSALGDRDTICAMVGGMLIMSCRPDTVPPAWVSAVEKVDQSVFRSKRS